MLVGLTAIIDKYWYPMSESTKPFAPTPPMGWNSWNMFGSRIHEDNIRETADALVSSGLRDLGYDYLVIDDCWSQFKGRDQDGNLVPDERKFPGGMKALTDYIHSKGLKAGIYSCTGDKTCAGYPGSYGFEDQDAALWAEWGFDFLKYDFCYTPNEQAESIKRYTAMGEALAKTGRPFLFSLCEWGSRGPHLWGRNVGGHMWRVTGDIFDSWVDFWVAPHKYYGIGVDTAIDVAAELAPYGGPDRWNDLDMLIVGLKGKGQIHGCGMSFLEYQTHMSLWVIACSPLMIGCDIRNMDEDTTKLLTNTEVLAVNQDPLGIPGRRVKQTLGCDVFMKPLADGSKALAIINRGSRGQDVEVLAREFGTLDVNKKVRDLWLQEDIMECDWSLKLRVEPHETKLLKVS